MNLRDILPEDAVCDPRFAALPVLGITADSRAVRPGMAFAAVPGTKADGLAFAPQAVAAGAAVIVAERALDVALPEGVALVTVPDVRRALALIAARLSPRQPETIAAVTGTSGKTSVAAFTRQIWTTLGHRAASVGTVGVVAPGREIYGSLTTPDPVALHATLDTLAGDGVTHLAIEASSHGLDQHRLDGLRIAAAGFTNLSRDHLDYHATLDAYLAAKLILFERLLPAQGVAVIAADHEHAASVIAASRKRGARVMTVGRRGDDLKLVDAAIDGFSQTLTIAHGSAKNGGGEKRIRLPLVGAFQVENALVAAGLAIATGGETAAVLDALEGLAGAKGRLELVGHRNGAPIFVDYAHKPDALAKALEALRPYTQNRLVVVFGAGGDRDAGKRALMGEIAGRDADHVIVTDDNPRSEDPAAIRRAILDATPGAREIGDRRAAIRAAVEGLEAGDVLLVAGKGHETGQIVRGVTTPFSDHDEIAAALAGAAA